jgi:hypothetical protein
LSTARFIPAKVDQRTFKDANKPMNKQPLSPNLEADANGIRVVVRVKPFDSKTQSILTICQNSIRIDNCTYTYDDIAGPEVNQDDMHRRYGKQILDSSLAGYNSTIFCYGSTGSGKTHTMTGSNKMDGLIPKILQDLFANPRITNTFSYSISITYLEIYMEKVYDLLTDTNKELKVRDHPNQGVYAEGLTQQYVCSVEGAIHLLNQGLTKRHTEATIMNRSSSRSHAIFTIKIVSEENREGQILIRSSQLNLVDLAGSERMDSTGVEGDRIGEACSINKSLSELGNVILALSNENAHVNYRSSKLTHLLKHSLGGNCKTLFIANISVNGTEVSTLKFIERLKLIKNQPKVMVKRQEIKELELEQLYQELEKQSLIQEKFKQESDEAWNMCETLDNCLVKQQEECKEYKKRYEEQFKKYENAFVWHQQHQVKYEESLKHMEAIVHGRDQVIQNLQFNLAKVSSERDSFKKRVQELECFIEEEIRTPKDQESVLSRLTAYFKSSSQ